MACTDLALLVKKPVSILVTIVSACKWRIEVLILFTLYQLSLTSSVQPSFHFKVPDRGSASLSSLREG